jgi:hypothetical protein
MQVQVRLHGTHGCSLDPLRCAPTTLPYTLTQLPASPLQLFCCHCYGAAFVLPGWLLSSQIFRQRARHTTAEAGADNKSLDPVLCS